MGKLKILIPLIVIAIVTALTYIISTNAYNSNEKDITFVDENLYIKVKDGLGDKVISSNNETKTLRVKINDVKDISISNAEITDLSGIEQFENLQSLHISNKILVRADNDDISGVSYGKVNNIEKVAQLHKLKELSLTFCQIDDGDLKCLGEFKLLKSLTLNKNNITDISKISCITNLEQLSVSDNKIEDISVLSNCKKMKNLYLNNNNIKDITALKMLNNIETLELNNNEITDISILKDMTSIKTLKLSGNRITDISCLGELRAIQTIEISENHIGDFSYLMQLPNLKLNDRYVTNLGKQNIVIRVKDGESVYLPPIVKQSKELFTKTKTIDCINCTPNENYTMCQVNPGVEGARIRISDGSFENTIVTLQIADTTDETYRYTNENNIGNQNKDEDIIELPKIPVIICSSIIAIILVGCLIFVIVKK